MLHCPTSTSGTMYTLPIIFKRTRSYESWRRRVISLNITGPVQQLVVAAATAHEQSL